MKGRERKKTIQKKERNKEEMRYTYKVEGRERKRYKRRLRKERKRVKGGGRK